MNRTFLSLLLCAGLCACATPEPNNPAPPAKPKAEMDHSQHTAPAKKAEAPAPKPAPEPAKPVVTDDGSVATVALTGSDQMKYNTDRIEVAAGRTVKLTLTHVGKMPLAAMGHNFVLLKPGTDGTEFARAAITAKDTDYVPAALADKVIAHTSVVGGGDSTSIEFPAPPLAPTASCAHFPGMRRS